MRKIILLALLTRVLIIIYPLIGKYFIPLNPGYLGSEDFPELSSLLSSWANFDGRHFIDIATKGYRGSNYVYFPLYPLLISLFSKLTKLNPVLIGVSISLICYFLAVIVLAKYINIESRIKNSRLFFLLFFLFPFSYYYQTVYSESLFFLFALLSFYNAQKGNWSLGCIFCSLACLTHITGAALVFALLVELFEQHKRKLSKLFVIKGVLVSISGLLGPGLFALYLYIFYGNPFLFLSSYSTWHRESVTFPLQVVWRYIKIFINFEPSHFVFWVSLLEFLTATLYLYLSIICIKHIKLSYGIFIITTLIISSLTGSFVGFPRYTLHLFPGYMALAYLFEKNQKHLLIPTLLLFIILGFLFTTLFIRGHFLA